MDRAKDFSVDEECGQQSASFRQSYLLINVTLSGNMGYASDQLDTLPESQAISDVSLGTFASTDLHMGARNFLVYP